MIARFWHGTTKASKGDAYLRFLEESGIKGYRETEGNRGVYVFRRTEGDRTHFLLLSLWDSLDAVRTFAGPAIERAVYYPEDKDFLLEFEPNEQVAKLRFGRALDLQESGRSCGNDFAVRTQELLELSPAGMKRRR